MFKRATDIEGQIAILKSRGMFIADVNKAKEIFLDIGYYRLGFYTFPFELQPHEEPRTHRYEKGTNFDDVVELYYFDHDLRHILLRYVSRIEVNVRTFITYTVSNYYKDNPTWFVSPRVVNNEFRESFEQKIYGTLRKNPCIISHHRRYENDRYAPAWKTLEFMTLGSIITLYESLQNDDVRLQIAQHYGLRTIALFDNYLQTIKVLRNACAHGSHIFDLCLIKAVKKGPLCHFDANHRHDIYSVLLVVLYFLHHISENRENEFLDILKKHIEAYANKPHIAILNDFLQKVLSEQK